MKNKMMKEKTTNNLAHLTANSLPKRISVRIILASQDNKLVSSQPRYLTRKTRASPLSMKICRQSLWTSPRSRVAHRMRVQISTRNLLIAPRRSRVARVSALTLWYSLKAKTISFRMIDPAKTFAKPSSISWSLNHSRKSWFKSH